MDKAVIYGAGDFGQLLCHHLRKTPGCPQPGAFVVGRQWLAEKSCMGLPVTAAEDMQQDYPPGEWAVYLCVGYTRMNRARAEVLGWLTAAGYPLPNYIHPAAMVDAAVLGAGNIILQGVVVDAFTTLGDGNVLYPAALVAHHCEVGSFNYLAVNACVAGHATLGNGCFIGAHATVRNGVTLGSHVLVGAGAYASCNAEDGAVIVPARSRILQNKTSDDFEVL